MSAQDNKEVIKELEHVQNLLYEANEKNIFLTSKSDEQFDEKMISLREELGVLEKPSVFSNFPVFPLEKSYYAATEKDAESKKSVFRIALIITIVLLVLYFIIKVNFLNTISVIGIFATGLLGLFYKNSKKEYKKKKDAYDKSVEEYNKTNQAFLDALEVYDEEKAKAINFAKDYSEKYSETHAAHMLAFYEKITAEEEANARIIAIEEELNANNTIVPEYYHLISDIITNLKSGRADDYKEALNIAIRDEKEENERQAMLAKEEERNMLLAMQAEEERRHNEQMERQQREHDEAVLREQKRQNEAMARQQQKQAWDEKVRADRAAAAARDQANKTRMAGVSKCASCANSKHCPSYIKNNGSGLTCGGYVPYGAKR